MSDVKESSSIRVLHMFPFLGIGGGGAHAALTLIREQQKRRPTWVFALVEDEFSEEARKTGSTVLTAFGAEGWPKSRIKRWVGTVRAMRQAVRSHSITLIHGHSAPGNRYCYPVSRLTGVPLVSHQRDTYKRDHFHAWVHRTDKIIATSDWVRSNLPKELHAKATVVHDAVKIPTEADVVWPRGEGPLVIGMAGRCVPEKGHDLLLKAAAALSGRFEFSVAICGVPEEGGEEFVQEVRRMAAVPALHGRVRLQGFRLDMHNFYREIDVMVVPSRVAEGFGLTAAEGQVSGKAVVVAGHGGLAEIVRHGESGLHFVPHDAGSLEEQLQHMLGDALLRRKLAEEGRRSGVARFSPQAHTDRVEAVYREVLGGAGK